MPNFMKLLNTSWQLQPLELFASEFREFAKKELEEQYPLLNVIKSKYSEHDYIFQYGLDTEICFSVNVYPTKEGGAIKTAFDLCFKHDSYGDDTELLFYRDSRYFSAIVADPMFLMEVILDEVNNYFESVYILKGTPLRSRYNSYKKSWTNNEVIFASNLMIPSLEPLRFCISPYLPPNKKAGAIQSLEFVLMLLMKPVIYTQKDFNMPHFSFMFYNDRRPEAKQEWNNEINKLLGKDR